MESERIIFDTTIRFLLNKQDLAEIAGMQRDPEIKSLPDVEQARKFWRRLIVERRGLADRDAFGSFVEEVARIWKSMSPLEKLALTAEDD